MKKLLIIALAFAALQVTAQEQRGEHRKGDRKEKAHNMYKDMSAEEIATLKTKKMVLHLDLNDAQQREIYKLNLENAKDRKEKMETRQNMKDNGEKRERPSSEERYKMMNERLDKQIEQKRKLKSILTPEQYEKFEKGMKHRKMKQHKRAKNRAEKRRS